MPALVADAPAQDGMSRHETSHASQQRYQAAPPPATLALLQELGTRQDHLNLADTTARDTAHAEHEVDTSLHNSAVKSTVLRVVLGGWMDVLASEESPTGEYRGLQSSETLALLLSSLSGPVEHLSKQPHLFVMQPKSQELLQAQALASTQRPDQLVGTSAGGELDLVDFLVHRALRAATSLQMALFLHNRDDDQAAMDIDQNESVQTDLRPNVVKQFVKLLSKTIVLLAESTVKTDWHARDQHGRGGSARAMAIVNDIFRIVRALLQRDSSKIQYPREFRFETSHAHVFPEAEDGIVDAGAFTTSSQAPRLSINSALHGRAFCSVALQVLCQAIGKCTTLQESWPDFLKLLVLAPPAPPTRHFDIHKGKYRGLSPEQSAMHTRITADIVEMMHSAIDESPIAFKEATMTSLAPHAMSILRNQIHSGSWDVDKETERVRANLLLIFSRMWNQVRTSLCTLHTLAQNIASFASSMGGDLMSCLAVSGDSMSLRSKANEMTISARDRVGDGESRMLPAITIVPEEESPLTEDALEDLVAPPELSRSVEMAINHIRTALRDNHPNVDGSNTHNVLINDSRKRKRDDIEIPSSDVFDLDGRMQPPPATARRRRTTGWREAITKVLEDHGLTREIKMANEGVEKLICRLAGIITSPSTPRAASILEAVGFLACARAGTFQYSHLPHDDTSAHQPECTICDKYADTREMLDARPSGVSERLFTKPPLAALEKIAAVLLDSESDGVDTTAVTLALLRAIPRVARHSTSIAASSFALESRGCKLVWLQMENKSRSTRVAACHAMLSLAVLTLEADPSEPGVEALLPKIETLLSHKHAMVSETGLLFAKQMACFSAPQSLMERRILEMFVQRFGHPNFFLRQRVRSHLNDIALFRRVKVYALVQPHFTTIAPLLFKSPIIFNAAVECFGQPADSLLRITREFTLPGIIASRSLANLQRVAQASGTSVPAVLTDTMTAASILAHLYMLPDAELREGVHFFMAQVNSLDAKVDLPFLIDTLKVPLVYKLALELGDEDEARTTQAKRALINVERQHRSAPKQKFEVGLVLKNCIVGILSHMNRGLNESSAHRPMRDKQQIIRALMAVTTTVGPAISGFSPQSALEVGPLRTETLKAFEAFVKEFKFHEIGPYLGPISSLFVRLHNELTPPQREIVKRTIEYIVIDNADNLANFVQDVADLSGVPELDRAARRLHRVRAKWSQAQRIEYFISRIANENDAVAYQALKELQPFLAESEWTDSATKGDTFEPLVGDLIRALLNAIVRDGVDQKNVRDAALACLGCLGALDPARIDVPSGDSPFTVLDNFENRKESIEFALHLIQDMLIGIYRSTNDTKHQEFLAFAIQSLLNFCGFTKALLTPGADKTADEVTWARWSRLPKFVHETCGPLLGGSFSIHQKEHARVNTYPIYTQQGSYRDWIRTLTNDLVLNTKRNADEGRASVDAFQIFQAFNAVLYLDDIAVAQYLLPHVVLTSIISGTDHDRQKIKQEMQVVLADQVDPSPNRSDHSRLLSAQTIFGLMDHLSRWITHARKRSQDRRGKRAQKSSAELALEKNLANVEGVLQDIPHILVGQAAQVCKAFARSLLNFESHIVGQQLSKDGATDANLQDYYESLHDCYAALDEPDGMEGISTKIITPSLQHQIIEHESTGRWTSAQSCWEVRLQQKPNDSANHVGLLRCLRYLGHYDSMRTHIAGVLQIHGDDPEWRRTLAPFGMEAALFAGDWQAVDSIIKIADADGPEIAFGKVLRAIASDEARRDGKDVADDEGTPTLAEVFSEAREQFGAAIVAAGRESYRRVYDDVVNLHMLEDLRKLHSQKKHVMSKDDHAQNWLVRYARPRFEATSPSFRVREPILNIQRTAFRLLATDNVRNTIAKLWLQTSKIARKAGHTQTAYSAVLQARDMNSDIVFYQRAKLLKAMDEPTKAIQDIGNALQLQNFQAMDDEDGNPNKEKYELVAKAQLLQAKWLLEAGRLEHNDVVVHFNNPIAFRPKWDAPHFFLGKYMDDVAGSLVNRKTGRHYSDERELGFRYETVKHYSMCLALGTKYIYQAMPRMLTIWLELGDEKTVLDAVQAKKKSSSAVLTGRPYEFHAGFLKMNRIIHKTVKGLPTYEFLTVLPQLVSRILHQNDHVWDVLQQILHAVLREYPQHGFWGMASGAKSTIEKRRRRNMKILDFAKSSATKDNRQLAVEILDQGLRLVDELLRLCNWPIQKTDNLSMCKTFPQLDNMMPLSLIIPTQSSLTVTLPARSDAILQHNAFPDRLVKFHSFDDTIVIMSSLQRPRKITVNGDDGRQYSFLCKPKDDLRKDARLMEFNSMIIKLLKKDSDARSRHLGIRTYAVVPLNEDCGLIEWVPHTIVLRGILNKAYVARGIHTWGPELKNVFDKIRDDPKEIGPKFEAVAKGFPPVFHRWFLETFPEPSAWLRARLSYSRTAAVISMVGFVLGLGDRHCENILLDSTTGDTVHVDFNCLFDRGRTFDVPEQVPFRLTHNIIDGMGVTGVEGVFRRAAEITLRILRTNRDSLMSVLETFLHDPLVEWVPTARSRTKDHIVDQATHIQNKAKNSLDPINNKLRGLQVTSAPSSLGVKEVSVVEQVERLIREARNSKNLGSMYVGWCAWF
ncbi:hypothetical protein OIO90_000859 [Microbotryomycetes sp. JL221]|nr:hypothetical protein OIO90_000859 [Microbotryomycetes sp. JL221]